MRKMIATSRRARAVAVAFAAGAIALAAPAVAAACPGGELSQPFARFGDLANYTPVPGGSFESNGEGWTLNGTRITNENNWYGVAGGSHSLEIFTGGEAVSPELCVNAEYPTFRFFARQLSGRWTRSTLQLSLRWTDAEGTEHETSVGAISDINGGSWEPSPVTAFGTALPIWNEEGEMSAQLVFKSPAGGSRFEIDDVYVDPYSR